MEKFERRIIIWTIFLFAVSFLWGFFMTGFIAYLGGWMMSPLMVLYLSIIYFLNPPISTIWIIGILIIFYKRLKELKKE